MTEFGAPKYVPENGHTVRVSYGKSVNYGTANSVSTYDEHFSFVLVMGQYIDEYGDIEDVEIDIDSAEGWTVEQHFELPMLVGAVVTLDGDLYVRGGEAGAEYPWISLSDPGADCVRDDYFTDKRFFVQYKGVEVVGDGDTEGKESVSEPAAIVGSLSPF